MKVTLETEGVTTGNPQESRTPIHQNSPIPTSEVLGFCTSTLLETPDLHRAGFLLAGEACSRGAAASLGSAPSSLSLPLRTRCCSPRPPRLTPLCTLPYLTHSVFLLFN